MTTLDRYIARQYLFNTVALLVLLGSFVVTIDATLNIGDYLKRADELLKGHEPSSLRRILLAVLLVFDLWWPRLLQLFAYMAGLALVGAMGFTFTQMVRHREMVAILASGISLPRVARPVLIVAACVMGLKVIDQEFVLSHPSIAPLLTRETRDAGKRDWADFQVNPTRDGAGRIWMARNFEPATQTLSGVSIWERSPDGRGRRLVSAESAAWRTDGPSGGWDLAGVTVRPMDLTPSGGGGGGAMDEGGEADQDPLAAPARIETDLDPAALKFRRFASFSQSLSWRQVSQMLESGRTDPALREKLERTRYGRISTILSSLISLVITIPFFLVREPTNMLMQSLKCAPVGILSLMGGILGAAVEVPGLPPGFAVFLPVFILIPVAIATTSSVRT